jgi:hypothetical protein
LSTTVVILMLHCIALQFDHVCDFVPEEDAKLAFVEFIKFGVPARGSAIHKSITSDSMCLEPK